MTNNKLNAESGKIEIKMGLHATAHVMANFAWQHLKAATIFRNHLLVFMLENIPNLGWMIATSAFVVMLLGLFRITNLLRAFSG